MAKLMLQLGAIKSVDFAVVRGNNRWPATELIRMMTVMVFRATSVTPF